jgi:hypothetical protein
MAGRPSDYSEELADLICTRIADGESVRAICADDDMPDKATVFRWLAKHESFRDQYAQAKAAQAEHMADEILDIADDGSNDWMERRAADGSTVEVVNGEHIQRSRLRVDSRKWLLSKLLPKKYGDRITNHVVGGDDDAPVRVEVTDRDRAKAMARLIAKGKNVRRARRA